ncbi:MAG: hypothetical protein ACI9YR_002521, partial [Bacteroidia bacterium]
FNLSHDQTLQFKKNYSDFPRYTLLRLTQDNSCALSAQI